jgi:thioredoxin reductase
MASIIIIGDGPAGLSAALFLAKNGQDVTVFGQDETPMHYAMLYNYLGIPEITGSDFQKVARGQVEGFGTKLMADQVTSAEQSDSGFIVTTANGTYNSDYLIIAEGKGLKIAESMGLPQTDQGVEVDHNYRTGVARLYVVGRSVRKTRSQAIISAGTGATAALDILATEQGKDFVDYDSVS